MDIKKYEYKNIGEVLYSCQFDNGLKAFVIPKKGYFKKHIAYAVNYGSIDNQFTIPDESEPTTVPDGIAHFLEHKLFEQEDGSVMDKYAELGSSPNAYTGFSQTVYLVSCTDKFDENLQLLLKFVQNPYLTDESVENEKGIIGQEIRMYQDDPSWQAYFNLLKLLYHINPVSTEIAGSQESISKIDKDTLYKCYNAYYHPSNMIVIAVGDIDAEYVFDIIEKGTQKAEKKPLIKRFIPAETESVVSDYSEKKLAVSNPLFQMGFKDVNFTGKGSESILREIAINLILEIIVGRSSSLYEKLYSEGLINGMFESSYIIEEGYAFSILGGESKNPIKVKDIFLEQINNINKSGLSKADFQRVKNAMYGKYLRQFNSIERTANTFISVCFRDINIFDYPDVYDKITFESVSNIYKEHFNVKNFALSVINPV